MPTLIKYLPVYIEVTGLIKGSVTALFACSIRCGVQAANLFTRILLNSGVILFQWTLLLRLLGIVHACLVADNIAVGHFTLGRA